MLLSNKKRSIFAAIMLSGGILILSGCAIKFDTGTSTKAVDGGVFKSTNQGAAWTQATLTTNLAGKTLDIRNIDVYGMAMDPGDPKTIYLASLENGVYYTYDGGATWMINEALGKILVNSFAVDYKNKCVLYIAVANRLNKSVDCGRFWAQSYFDNDPSVVVRSIAVDPANSSIIYISTSRGEIIKSQDAGLTWRTVGRLETNVTKIFAAPYDSKVIFAGTADKGLYRSLDAGENWEALDERLSIFNDHNRFRDLAFSASNPGTIYLANYYGLLKTTDNGNNWTKIELITPDEEAVINSIAVSPMKADEVYYVTNTTFYHSTDGGKNWSSRKLPTSRAGVKIIIDPKSPGTIYLGARKYQ